MGLFSTSFFSTTLMRMVDVQAIVPTPAPSDVWNVDREKLKGIYTPAAKYPVLYLFHGYGGDSTVWLRYSSLERYAEERNIAVVTISGENKFYANRTERDHFYDFIENELQEFVCGYLPISSRSEDTFIAGLSMGGFGALLHGLSNPEKYHAIGGFSAGMDHTGNEQPVNSIFETGRPDLFLLMKKTAAEGKLPKAYLSCGMKDSLFAINKEFKDTYLSLGGDITWEEMEQYDHEWAFWDDQIRKFLDWIPRSDAYAKLPRRNV